MNPVPGGGGAPAGLLRREHLPALSACLGFVLYLSFIMLTRPVSAEAANYSQKGQMLGVAAFVLLGLPFLASSLGHLVRGCRRSALVFYLFWVLLAALTPFGRWPAYSALYVVLTFAVFFSAGNLWAAPGWMRQAAFGAVALVCFAICARIAFSQELNVGRHLGLVTPNHFAAFALTPALLAFAFPAPVRWGIRLLALGFILFVGARGALLALVLCTAVEESGRMLVDRAWHRLLVAVLAGGLVLPAVSALLLSSSGSRASAFAAVNSVLALDDPARGVDSGFSGRLGNLQSNIDVAAENLGMGTGFRSARGVAATHNAYLDLLIETGGVAAGLFLLFVVLRVLQLVRTVACPLFTPAVRKEAAGVLGGMSAVLLLANFELWLLNIGFPVGACALAFYAFHEPEPSGAGRPAASEGWAGRGELPCPT